MSTFIKADLIKSLEDAITACEQSLAEYRERLAQFHREYAAGWEERQIPKIKQLRDELTKALKKGGLIDRSELRKKVGAGSDLDDLFYHPPANYLVRSEAGEPDLGSVNALTGAIAEYQGLIKLLNAITDETISTNQLKTMGFRDLQKTFMAAGQK